MWVMIYLITTTYPFILKFSTYEMCQQSRPAIEDDLRRYQTIPASPLAITTCAIDK